MGAPIDSRVTGFYGQVGSTVYRAVLLKQSGANLHLWSLYDTTGTLLFVDFRNRTTRLFQQVVGGHRTLHASGDVHSRVELNIGSKHRPKFKSETLEKKECWRDCEITIPLDSIPSETPEHAPWSEVTRGIVLRSVDFQNAAGVNLIFCLATPETLAMRERWDRSWVLSGDRTVIVGAERIPYPGMRS